MTIRKSKLALISFGNARFSFVTMRTSNKKERQVAVNSFRNTRHCTNGISSEDGNVGGDEAGAEGEGGEEDGQGVVADVRHEEREHACEAK